MISDQEITTLLQKTIRRTGRGMLLVGLLALPLGLFMIALHVLKLDPSAGEMSTGMLAALYGFAILFIGTGILMIYAALFKNAAKGQRFLDTLAHRPEQIKQVTHKIIQAQGAPGKLGQAHQIIIGYAAGGNLTLSVKARDAEPILGYLAARAPHAVG